MLMRLILQDPEKRAQYDRESLKGAEEIRHSVEDAKGYRSTNHPFSDTFYKIFSEVFEDERETYAADLQVELKLSFMEAAKGCTKHVSFSAQVPCESCYGRGHLINAKPSRCPTCNGVGRVTVFPFTSTCSSCKGQGKLIKDFCLVCEGSGMANGVKDVNVTIPAGFDSGDTICVPKAGNHGGRGIQPGNLYIELKVEKDPVFQRDGTDIYVDTRISFTQASNMLFLAIKLKYRPYPGKLK
ncbi:chaperone protein dnaJ 1, mitochondrial isoform X2 [Iris pallida]|uniref:Chaperone protein dnaJ 1, mitochondrial isoform X2 n=1 Tax=Iris pallida TaxID=29817 RepID=A0AAX6FIC6_IRIPA|nr:chaperone protein dnaJ 1, mitochondrial isoform X2 [Iris pallida]KAJ6834514.1 chaperone protein dnaJ 1, mitochondrial isoform X2 [Iris pallida]